MLSDFVRRNPAWEGTNELTVPIRDKSVKSFIRGNQFFWKKSRYCSVLRELVCNVGFVLQEGHINNINTRRVQEYRVIFC